MRISRRAVGEPVAHPGGGGGGDDDDGVVVDGGGGDDRSARIEGDHVIDEPVEVVAETIVGRVVAVTPAAGHVEHDDGDV